jgi:hypothetical protein
MKNYLSFGGGVNSVAMMLLLMDEGMEFGPGKDCEAIYVWMPDWPETHEYLMMLEDKGYPITVILPNERRIAEGKSWYNLYDYCKDKQLIPYRMRRWCTSNFKIKTLLSYQIPPAFVMIGIGFEEAHRAKLSINAGIENRFPLIEREITRSDCIEIIKAHGLPVPIKSGCWLCPFQRKSQFKQLRRTHSDLFCKLIDLEKQSGKLLIDKKKTLVEIVNEPDTYLFADMAYPPCQCGL